MLLLPLPLSRAYKVATDETKPIQDWRADKASSSQLFSIARILNPNEIQSNSIFLIASGISAYSGSLANCTTKFALQASNFLASRTCASTYSPKNASYSAPPGSYFSNGSPIAFNRSTVRRIAFTRPSNSPSSSPFADPPPCRPFVANHAPRNLYASVSSALRQRSSASSSVSSCDGFDVVVFDDADDADDDPSYPYVQSNPFFSRCNGRRPDVRRNASARRSRDDAPYDVDASSSSSTSCTSFVCDALEDAHGGRRDRAGDARRTHRRPTTFGDADAHDVVAPDAHRIVVD